MEAAVKDFKRIAEEHSITASYLIFAKEDIAKLTAELDALKAKYNDADFNFKKFDVSSTVVETMIEKQLKFKNQDKDKLGLGYNEVPPPFNDNYTLPLESKESETPMVHGKPSSETTNVNDTNVSTSCAGKILVDEGHKNEHLPLKTSDLFSVDSKTVLNDASEPVSAIFDATSKPVALIEPIVFVKPGFKSVASKCVCMCDCNNDLKQRQKSNYGASTSSGPKQTSTTPVLKKQTCFSCGIAGHIARNCPKSKVPSPEPQRRPTSKRKHSQNSSTHSGSRDGDWNVAKAKQAESHKYVPSPDHKWITVPSGRIFKIDLSKSRSDGDWNKDKTKTKKAKEKKPMPNPKGNRVSNPSATPPIIVSNRILKPVYKWVVKGVKSKTNNNLVKSTCSEFDTYSEYDTRDMTWNHVSNVNSNCKPSRSMTWVPNAH